MTPDIMCVSKGLTGGFLPMAATIATRPIHESFCAQDRSRTFFHGHSYTANPLGCAAGIASLRMIGTVAAIELRDSDPGYFSSLRSFLCDFYLQRGVLLRPLGNVVYILPPYVITAAELHRVYDVIGESLDALPRR
jgi:adenosylmethionine-8-amino-7-oxononanoate aminotransferase